MAFNFLVIVFLISIPTVCDSFYFINNKNNFGLSAEFLKELHSVFCPDVFIETGTCGGSTTQVAASVFKKVYTVELSHSLYNEAKKKLLRLPNVSMYYGNSPQFLKEILPQCKGQRILLWLDAHTCGGGTAMSNDNPNDPEAITPIRKELEAVVESGLENVVILIDDIRGFGSMVNGIEYLSSWPYPTVQEIRSICDRLNPNFKYALIGDQLLIFDSTRYNPTLSSTVEACTQMRFYDGYNLTDEQVLLYEKSIMHALPEEKKYLAQLHEAVLSLNASLFHYALWFGLTCMGLHNWQEAYKAIQSVPLRMQHVSKTNQKVNQVIEYTHPRIKNYLDEIKKNLNKYVSD